MLTIKAPIQLHIAQGLTGNADAFGERIRGNYGMMGARYTPKDLLFLLIAPPELPEETGGMTTLVTQQSNVDVRTVTMDVVNNVVNRILLDGTQQFTYQDQVYITSVLNRLGITDVQQFMQQVRQLRSENENTVQLTRLYRSHVEKILQRQAEILRRSGDNQWRKRFCAESCKGRFLCHRHGAALHGTMRAYGKRCARLHGIHRKCVYGCPSFGQNGDR